MSLLRTEQSIDGKRPTSNVQLPSPYLDFVTKLNAVSIPTRYPEDLERAIKNYDEKLARQYLGEAQEVLRWLKQHPDFRHDPALR